MYTHGICIHPPGYLALCSDDETVWDGDLGSTDVGGDIDWCGEDIVYGYSGRNTLTNLYGEFDDVHYSRRGGFVLNMVVLVFLRCLVLKSHLQKNNKKKCINCANKCEHTSQLLKVPQVYTRTLVL